MLTPRELELLTAHVDGSLSSQQRREVARLLQRSDEARRLLQALMSDSRELQLAPVVAAPIDFSAQVMEGIKSGKVVPPRTTVRRPLTLYLGYAAAALVFVAVGVASFLSHRPTRRPVASSGETVAAHQQPIRVGNGGDGELPRAVAPSSDSAVGAGSKGTSAPNENDPLASWMTSPSIVRVAPAEESDEPDEPAMPESPTRPMEGSKPPTRILTSGQREVPNQLERVEFALPRVHVFHGLDVVEQSKALREQLALGSAYRIDIPARDAGRGLERLRLALTGHKSTLTITADAQLRMKKPIRSDYALFVENIAPEDLADALRTAGLADRTAAQKRSIDLYFEGPLVVREMTRTDRRELKELFGVVPSLTLPAAPTRAENVSDGTMPNAVANASGSTSKGRPGVARGPSVGIVLPLPAARMRSVEVKKFLDQRVPTRPGTLQVLVILRNVG